VAPELVEIMPSVQYVDLRHAFELNAAASMLKAATRASSAALGWTR
jgi:hypothetical protein